MRRRDVNHSRVIGISFDDIESDAFPINRDGRDTRARANENSAHTEISRVFHQNRVARIEQHLSCKFQRDLGAGHDNYLIRLAFDRSRRSQISGDHLSQARITGHVRITEQIVGRGATIFRQQARPDLKGKGRQVGKGSPKWRQLSGPLMPDRR
jgi:hypothetical protein